MLGSNEATLTLVLKARDQASKQLSGLNRSLGGLNLGLGAVVLGVTAFAGILGKATQMAIEEEANIAKLGAALKANVPAWDGNTAGIERLIKVRENLAFSDDELRNSLAQLVVATHDVTKAANIQRVAMDLARLKGISLEEATAALVKTEAGQYRILKSLGIQLPKNATQQEVLTAVTKAANGQAEAYANTVGGKMLTAQIKMDDAMEDFGRVTMPVVTEALNVVTRALDRQSISYAEVKAAADKGSMGARAQLNQLDKLNHTVDATAQGMYRLAAAARAAAKRPSSNGLQSWLNARADAAQVLAANLIAAMTAARALASMGNPGVGKAQGHAAGGWVGLHGPEMALVGERGPEYVIPNHQLGKSTGGSGGFTIQGVSERQILDMVERGLYFRLQRAAPTRSAV